MKGTQSSSTTDYYQKAATGGGGTSGGYTPYVDPSYKQCPNCLRNFNQEAADRHMPVCAKKAKENAIKSKGASVKQSTTMRSTVSKSSAFGGTTMTSTRGFKQSNY